jgi:hypothetical protein
MGALPFGENKSIALRTPVLLYSQFNFFHTPFFIGTIYLWSLETGNLKGWLRRLSDILYRCYIDYLRNSSETLFRTLMPLSRKILSLALSLVYVRDEGKVSGRESYIFGILNFSLPSLSDIKWTQYLIFTFGCIHFLPILSVMMRGRKDPRITFSS